MQVLSLHPGVSMHRVRDNTGFDIDPAPDVGETAAPTETELRILREEVDPLRYVIGR
jgi:glutaconate CoA-transferase subunit B